MIENLLFSKNLGLFQKALDTANLRNDVIANNLANVDTPGYKRFNVVFEEQLRKAMGTQGGITGRVTHPKHISIGPDNPQQVTARVVQDRHTTMRNDGNNVDIEKEMAALAKNQILYDFLVDGVSGEFKKLKSAISGRG